MSGTTNNTEYFLSINEVAVRLGLPAHTLRYWEKQFPSAIKPTTGAGGRRYYRPETVATLEIIRDHLYNRGMTIAGVKKLIKEDGLSVGADIIRPIASIAKRQFNCAFGATGRMRSAPTSMSLIEIIFLLHESERFV